MDLVTENSVYGSVCQHGAYRQLLEVPPQRIFKATSVSDGLDPLAVISDLRRLAEMSSDENGAQRLAWTPTWERSRNFYRECLAEIDLTPERDQAGNLWTFLPGRKASYVAVGSHLDSVPNGGWLDGALGVLAGVEIARSLRRRDVTPDHGLVLIDFADEEGARFGRSLLGSSAVSGSLESREFDKLQDGEGTMAKDVLPEFGVDPGRMKEAGDSIPELTAYLELHIEQGPVLERAGRAWSRSGGARDRAVSLPDLR